MFQVTRAVRHLDGRFWKAQCCAAISWFAGRWLDNASFPDRWLDNGPDESTGGISVEKLLLYTDSNSILNFVSFKSTFDCNYTFSIYLEPKEIPVGGKSIVKV